MKRVSLVISLLLLLSCKSSNNGDLHLFNNIMFKLHEGESKAQITQKLQDAYFHYIDKRPYQIPLFMIIEYHNYHIYVGIPVGTSMEEISGSSFLEGAQVISGPDSDLSNYSYRRYRHDIHYISEFAINIENNLLFLFAITDSKDVSDNMLNYNNLSNRIFMK